MNWINKSYHKLLETSQNPKKQKDFGYLILVIIALIISYNFYKTGFNFNIKINSLLSTFVVILILTITFKKVFLPILFVWLLLGEILGAITSTVIMGVVYFLLFSPIVLSLKLFRKEKPYKHGWKTVKRVIIYSKLS